MIIAFFGDVVGRSGRKAVAELLPELKKKHDIRFIIANVENVAGGFGITDKSLRELEKAGVDFFTGGNHIWDKREGVGLLESKSNIVRPANYPGEAPGQGYRILSMDGLRVAVVNLQGRIFMPPIDCPFQKARRCLEEIGDGCRIRIVDMHGEATSEKVAMGWYLDGKVSLVLGTHTHVPTKDARILPGGTGYVTDVGMTGSYLSVLGVKREDVLQRFLSMRPSRFDVAKGDIRCDLVIADIDERTGKTVDLEHVQLKTGA